MARSGRSLWARLLVSLAGGLGAGLLAALVLTLLDLYQSGHGQQPLSRPWLDVAALGVHLSRADVLFLTAAVVGVGLTWRKTASSA
jgi:H+/Cl- antiporter ClcA